MDDRDSNLSPRAPAAPAAGSFSISRAFARHWRESVRLMVVLAGSGRRNLVRAAGIATIPPQGGEDNFGHTVGIYERRGNKQEAIHFYKLSLQQTRRIEDARKQIEQLGMKSQ